jgi:hypothetical protein
VLREALSDAAALRLVLLETEAVMPSLGSAVNEALRECDADRDSEGNAAALLDTVAAGEMLGVMLTLGEAVQMP